MLKRIAIALAAVAALWSGAWVYGRHTILAQIETQAEALRANGGTATYDAARIGGFPIAYRGVIETPRVTLSDAASDASLHWNAPQIGAQATLLRPGRVAYSFPDRQSFSSTAAGEDTPRIEVEVRSQNLRAVQDVAGTVGTLDGSADAIRVDARGRDPYSGLATDVDVSGQQLRFDVAPDDTGVGFSGSVGDLRALITQSASTTESPPMAMEVAGATLTLSGTASDTRLRHDTLVEGLRLAFAGLSALDMGAAKARLAADLPTRSGTGAQAFGVNALLDDIVLSEFLWQQVDPDNRLGREIERIEVAMTGEAVFRPGFHRAEPYAYGRGGAFPLDVRHLKVSTARLTAFGVDVTASGEGRVVDSTPQGNLTISATGLPGFIERAVKSGLIPPQQGIVARLMLQNFSRPGARDGEMVFEIELRDGLSYINDVPVGPAPPLPQ